MKNAGKEREREKERWDKIVWRFKPNTFFALHRLYTFFLTMLFLFVPTLFTSSVLTQISQCVPPPQRQPQLLRPRVVMRAVCASVRLRPLQPWQRWWAGEVTEKIRKGKAVGDAAVVAVLVAVAAVLVVVLVVVCLPA